MAYSGIHRARRGLHDFASNTTPFWVNERVPDDVPASRAFITDRSIVTQSGTFRRLPTRGLCEVEFQNDWRRANGILELTGRFLESFLRLLARQRDSGIE